MDNPTLQALIISATTLLQPYLPTIATKVAEKIGEEVPSSISKLWKVINERFSKKPSAQETLSDLIKDPNNPDLQAAFRVQFKKLIEEDDEFAKNIKSLVENQEGDARHISRQSGRENISVQGNGNVFSQNQSGGITANNLIVNNISTNPTPVLDIKEILINQPHEGKFQSRFELSLHTPHPVGNLYIGVRASQIEKMDIMPMRLGMFMSGHAGIRDGYAFDNLQNAYGKYELRIITNKPERFAIEYNIE
ncbi:MAG: hypothetical protein HS100_11440 [Anaerolineales bacterium]|nr:hypothetical protein [Anaerolineales bacterium]